MSDLIVYNGDGNYSDEIEEIYMNAKDQEISHDYTYVNRCGCADYISDYTDMKAYLIFTEVTPKYRAST